MANNSTIVATTDVDVPIAEALLSSVSRQSCFKVFLGDVDEWTETNLEAAPLADLPVSARPACSALQSGHFSNFGTR